MTRILRSWREQKILLKRWFPILTDQDFVNASQDREGMMDYSTNPAQVFLHALKKIVSGKLCFISTSTSRKSVNL